MADPSAMGNLFGEAAAAVEEAEVEEVVRRKRRRKSREGCVNEEGLRFDDTVPVKTIHVANPAAAVDPPSQGAARDRVSGCKAKAAVTMRTGQTIPFRCRPVRPTRSPVVRDTLAVAKTVGVGFSSHAVPCPDPESIITSALRRGVKTLPSAP